MGTPGRPAPRGARADDPPPLLTLLYGRGQVLTLHDALLRLAAASPAAAAGLAAGLVRPGDHDDYARGLLRGTWCVLSPGAPPLRDGFTLAQASTQTELVLRAVEALLRAGGGGAPAAGNVLCAGFRRRRPSGGGRAVPGMASAEAAPGPGAGAAAAALAAPAWQLLAARAGDTLMLYVLLHASLFTRLDGGCVLQLAGRPLGAVARDARAAAAAADWMAAGGGGGGGRAGLGPGGERFPAAPPAAAPAPAPRGPPPVAETQDPVAFAEGSSAPLGAGAGEGGAAGAPRPRAGRPPSWQRRAAKRRRAAEAAAAAGAAGLATQQEEPTPTGSAPTPPPPPPLQQQPHVDQPPAAKRARGALTHWPARLQPPSDMVVPRLSIFYCASYARRPGLPAKHVLSRLKGRRDAGRRLFAAIFTPALNPVGHAVQRAYGGGGGGGSGAPAAAALPAPPRRVPARHRHLVPLLQALAERAGRCPYGYLLNRHCPLPLQLRRGAGAVGGGGHAAAAAAAAVPAGPAAADGPAGPSLDALMDELHELERPRAPAAPREAPAAPRAALAPAPESGPPARAPPARPRLRQSGLGQLVGEASQSLLAAAWEARGAGARGGGSGSARAPPPPAPPPAPPADIPATQPMSEDEGEPAPPAPPSPRPPPAPAAAPEALAACFVPHRRVAAFVWAVLRRIVPPALLGDARARAALRRAVARFVELRRHEQMSVHQAVQGLPTGGLPWLHPRGALPAAPAAATSGSGRASVPPGLAAAQQRAVALWVGWLLAGVAAPLLRAHFYVTESEAYRQQVFYYRKPVWARLAGAAVAALTAPAGGLFAPLPAGGARAALTARALGAARLRLLPKRAGMRAIVNLGRRSAVAFRAPRRRGGGAARGAGAPARRPPLRLAFKPVNVVLQNVAAVLKAEAARTPGCLGAAVHGLNDMYCRLQPFLRKWRAAAAAAAAAAGGGAAGGSAAGGAGAAPPASAGAPLSPRPFLVALDVARAFDSVSVPRLLGLVEPLLRSPEYVVVRYAEVVPALGGARVLARRAALPAEEAALAGGGAPLAGLAARAAAGGARNRGFVDAAGHERVPRAAALALLREHLRANLVRLRGAWHRQARGIPQGGTLSTLLCNLYLAAAEREHLAPLLADAGGGGGAPTGETGSGALTALARALPAPGPGAAGAAGGAAAGAAPPAHPPSLLMRLVDDVLLVTCRPGVAAAVAARMLAGLPDYGLAVNPGKTRLSFRLEVPAGAGAGGARALVVPPATWRAPDGGEFVRWCGLLLNVATLEVQADYARYSGEHVAATLTLPLRRAPGAALAPRLAAYLRPKVHPLLLDPATASPATARLNVYQAFLLAAMKFHCHVAALPAAPAPRAAVLRAAVEAGLGFMAALTRGRRVSPALGGAGAGAGGVACAPRIGRPHVRYLGLHAFRAVLRRKQARHGPLLAWLDAELGAPALARAAAALAPVVDPRRSAVFDTILY